MTISTVEPDGQVTVEYSETLKSLDELKLSLK